MTRCGVRSRGEENLKERVSVRVTLSLLPGFVDLNVMGSAPERGVGRQRETGGSAGGDGSLRVLTT